MNGRARRPREPDRDVPRSAGDSGQAMVEYAIVVAMLMGGLTLMSFQFLPEFINALQRYYDNFYILLNLPIP